MVGSNGWSMLLVYQLRMAKGILKTIWVVEQKWAGPDLGGSNKQV
jgi:hypothetical protein